MARLNWIEIQGFRPFGKEPQKLALGSDVGVVWAPNSQGKTSFAEAIEFLLTGSTCRCELTASAQDEFANSLRNAHIADTVAVVVSASIKDCAGVDHIVKRSLTQDYGKKHRCSSTLEIDGQSATEQSLLALGIALGDPPLAAPVLLQHTLGFLFSAKPQERADYFRALLEVNDVESIRALIAEAGSCLEEIGDPAIEKLRKCAALTGLGTELSEVESSATPQQRFGTALGRVTKSLLLLAGESTSGTEDEQVSRLRGTLTGRRERAFPLSGFDAPAEIPLTPLQASTWKDLTDFIEARKAVDKETGRLGALFTQVLSIPEIHGASTPVDCPVCLTKEALTPARTAAIKAALENSASYQQAHTVASEALRRIRSSVNAITTEAKSWHPSAVGWGHEKRVKENFRVPRVRALLDSNQQTLVNAWLSSLRPLLRKRRIVIKKAASIFKQIPARPEDVLDAAALEPLKSSISELEDCRGIAARQLDLCREAGKALQAPIKDEADKQSNTLGWEAFIDLFDERLAVESALTEQQARKAVRKEFEKAIKEIDRANNLILEAKFKSLSKEMSEWWERLRPDESTFFESVSPRPKARRSIDFKVGLANTSDRKDPQIRDAIAVLSHSQLHCLGIAAFIARVIRDGVGFMVLDDPIISSDEDHRPHFIRTVIENLLAKGVQIIVVTQDHRTWVDMNELYAHKNIDTFQLSKEPAGTVALKSSDRLAVMLSRAEPFVSSDSSEFRKAAAERLRDAGERFCKELLVKKRRENGDNSALITDYDGKTLGELIPAIQPFLVDASHAGKIKTLAKNLNPGKHDDTPPSKGELQCALGDLKRFKKDYLG